MVILLAVIARSRLDEGPGPWKSASQDSRSSGATEDMTVRELCPGSAWRVSRSFYCRLIFNDMIPSRIRRSRHMLLHNCTTAHVSYTHTLLEQKTTSTHSARSVNFCTEGRRCVMSCAPQAVAASCMLVQPGLAQSQANPIDVNSPSRIPHASADSRAQAQVLALGQTTVCTVLFETL